MRDILFAMIWVVLFPTAFFSSLSAILLWIWIALATPNLRLYEFMVDVPFNKIVAFATFFTLLGRREKKDFYVDSLVVLFSFFIVFCTISDLNPLYDIIDFDYNYDKITKIYVLFIVMTGIVHSRLRLHACVVVVVIAMGMIGGFEAAAYIISGGGHQVEGGGGLGDNNGVAIAVEMAIPLSFYLYQYSADRRMRLAFLGLMIAFLITVIATGSRGGVAGLAVLAITLLLNSRQKLTLGMIYIAAGIVLYFVVADSWFSRIDTIQDSEQNMSFLGRVMAWKISFLIAMDHPFTGGGFSAVLAPDVWTHYYPLSNQIGFIDTSDVPLRSLAAHSIYFQTLGDLGFTGFFCYMAIMLISLFKCRNIIRRCRKRKDMAWAADLARMLQISIIVYAAAGALLSFAYIELYWIYIAIVSRLDRTSLLMIDPPKKIVFAGEAQPVEAG